MMKRMKTRSRSAQSKNDVVVGFASNLFCSFITFGNFNVECAAGTFEPPIRRGRKQKTSVGPSVRPKLFSSSENCGFRGTG